MTALRTRRYRELLEAAARLVALPGWTYRGESFFRGEWLEALVLTESGGDPTATRYEPHQDRPGRRDSATDPDTPGHDDGLREDDTSFGLMQVMGYNLRSLVECEPGTRMGFGWALLPIANVAMGLRVLLGELHQTHGDVARALARYNGGPTGDDRDDRGVMRRQVYVDRVFSSARRVRRDRADAS